MSIPVEPKRPLVVLGSTSLFVPEVVDLANDTGLFDVKAFIENLDSTRTRESLLGRPVVWIDDAVALASTHEAICGIGTTKRQAFVEHAARLGFRFARIIHPHARVSTTATIGEGAIVSAGVIVAAHATIGRHVILNRGAMVGHHTTVGDFATLGPGANIGGAVAIEEAVYVGIGAVVVDRIRVGAHAFVSAGAVVARDVPERTQVLGNPARIVNRDIEGH